MLMEMVNSTTHTHTHKSWMNATHFRDWVAFMYCVALLTVPLVKLSSQSDVRYLSLLLAQHVVYTNAYFTIFNSFLCRFAWDVCHLRERYYLYASSGRQHLSPTERRGSKENTPKVYVVFVSNANLIIETDQKHHTSKHLNAIDRISL